MTRFLGMIDRLIGTVDCYLLQCSMDGAAARLAYEGIRRESGRA